MASAPVLSASAFPSVVASANSFTSPGARSGIPKDDEMQKDVTRPATKAPAQRAPRLGAPLSGLQPDNHASESQVLPAAYLVDDQVAAAVRYQRWLKNAGFEVAFIVGVTMVHIALCSQALIASLGEPWMAASFSVYDGIQFALVATLVCKVTAALRRAHLLSGLLQHRAKALAADARTVQVPHFLSSSRHALLIAAIAFLAANRFLLVDALACTSLGTTGRLIDIAMSFQQCRSIAIGGYPFLSLACTVIVMSMYSSVLALHQRGLAATLIMTYVLAFGTDASINYIVDKPGTPLPAASAAVLLLGALALALQLSFGVDSLESWWREHALLMFVADQHKSILEKERVAWQARVQTTAELVYERMSAYAAHELRNPLHVVQGTMDFVLETVDALNMTSLDPALLQTLSADCRTIASRTSAMKRIVEDLTDFWQLRGSGVEMSRTLVRTSQIYDAIATVAGRFDDGAVRVVPAPLQQFLPAACCLRLVTDVRRVEQIMAALVSYAHTRTAAPALCFVTVLDLQALPPSPGATPAVCIQSAIEITQSALTEESCTPGAFLPSTPAHADADCVSSAHVSLSMAIPLQASEELPLSNAANSQMGNNLKREPETRRDSSECGCWRDTASAAGLHQLARYWLTCVVTAESAEVVSQSPTHTPVSVVWDHAIVESIQPTAVQGASGRQPSSPTAARVERVQSSSLSLTVAAMLSRCLGGDVAAFGRTQASISSDAAPHAAPATARSYALLLPCIPMGTTPSGGDTPVASGGTRDSAHSSDASEPLHSSPAQLIGCCPRCSGCLPQGRARQAAPLFGQSGILPAELQAQVQTEMTACEADVLASRHGITQQDDNLSAIGAVSDPRRRSIGSGTAFTGDRSRIGGKAVALRVTVPSAPNNSVEHESARTGAGLDRVERSADGATSGFIATGSGTGTGPHLPSFNILYVDDERANRRLMARYLQQLDCSFVTLVDGVHVAPALARANMLTRAQARTAGLPWEDGGVDETSGSTVGEQRFTALILDVAMPRSDGAEVCRALRALGGKWSTIPIVAATGNAPDEEDLLRAGFTVVMCKPFSRATLQVVLQEHAPFCLVPDHHGAGCMPEGAQPLAAT